MRQLQQLLQLPASIETALLRPANVIRLLLGRLLLMALMVLALWFSYRPTA